MNKNLAVTPHALSEPASMGELMTMRRRCIQRRRWGDMNGNPASDFRPHTSHSASRSRKVALGDHRLQASFLCLSCTANCIFSDFFVFLSKRTCQCRKAWLAKIGELADPLNYIRASHTARPHPGFLVPHRQPKSLKCITARALCMIGSCMQWWNNTCCQTNILGAAIVFRILARDIELFLKASIGNKRFPPPHPVSMHGGCPGYICPQGIGRYGLLIKACKDSHWIPPHRQNARGIFFEYFGW